MTKSIGMEAAIQMDERDPVRHMRDRFHLPLTEQGRPQVYLVGNSLGLQPTRTEEYVLRELEAWRTLGVRAHFSGSHPWMPYHEFLTKSMAKLVGGRATEVVMMNSLTVNLHLMLATFYKPRERRSKIMLEGGAFPSDHIAIESHLRWHGRDPAQDMLIVRPESGRFTLPMDCWCEVIERHRDELSLILLPGVQYYSGQVFDLARLTRLAHDFGITIGFDLAHAAGNLELSLHDWQVDFAVWCSYKYLNSGPGSVGGCFIHENHSRDTSLVRLGGWWGHNSGTRFKMQPVFDPMPTADGWQLSNPPILSLAAIRASLDTFEEAGGMVPLREKSKLMTGLLRAQIEQRLSGTLDILTPPGEGCQLSIRSIDPRVSGRTFKQGLDDRGFETDWREPDVIRVAPVPLYNQFADVVRLVDALVDIREQRA